MSVGAGERRGAGRDCVQAPGATANISEEALVDALLTASASPTQHPRITLFAHPPSAPIFSFLFLFQPLAFSFSFLPLLTSSCIVPASRIALVFKCLGARGHRVQ